AAILAGGAAAREAARDAGRRFLLAIRMDIVDVDVAADIQRPVAGGDLERGRRQRTADRCCRKRALHYADIAPLPLDRCHDGLPRVARWIEFPGARRSMAHS